MGLDDYESILGNLALVFTIILQLSPLPVIFDIVAKGSTGSHAPSCFLCAIFGSSLWLKYAIMTGFSAMMISVLALTFVSDMIYMMIFYYYHHDKGTSHVNSAVFGNFYQAGVSRHLLIIVAVVSASIWYVDWSGVEPQVGVSRFGLLLCLSTVFYAAAPLLLLGQVIQMKSSEPLPCLLIVCTFLVSLVWFLYGIVVEDYYVMGSNCVSLVLGLAQLLLFVIYPRNWHGTALSVFYARVALFANFHRPSGCSGRPASTRTDPCYSSTSCESDPLLYPYAVGSGEEYFYESSAEIDKMASTSSSSSYEVESETGCAFYGINERRGNRPVVDGPEVSEGNVPFLVESLRSAIPS